MIVKTQITPTSWIEMSFEGLIDVKKTKTKLRKQYDALTKEATKLEQILSNSQFKQKAPADKVVVQEEELKQVTIQLRGLEEKLWLIANG